MDQRSLLCRELSCQVRDRAPFGDSGHHDFSSGSGSVSGMGFPNSAATFFWTSMMRCALRRSSVRRAFWRRSFWISSSIGLRLDFGPRFRGVKACSMPLARSRRQAPAETTTNPPTEKAANATSRRSSDLGFLQDALLIFSGVGLALRVGHLSGSGREAYSESALALAATPLRSQSLREPSLLPVTAKGAEDRTPREFPFISSFLLLALPTSQGTTDVSETLARR